MSDKFNLAGKTFSSRLIIGTGKYRSFQEMQVAHKASGAEMVTVAVNRVPLDGKTESFLDYLDEKMMILPNTAGCYDAEHAITHPASMSSSLRPAPRATFERKALK